MRNSESLKRELNILSWRYTTLLDTMRESKEEAIYYSRSLALDMGICKYLYTELGIVVNPYSLKLFNTPGYLCKCTVCRAITLNDTIPIQARIDWINNITEAQFNIILDLYKK